MDTSETYIKMSDHPKIQEHSPVKDDSGFHCRENNIFIVCGNYYEQHLVDLKKGKSSLKIWLPRQDEIQGMMAGGGRCGCTVCLVTSLYHFMENNLEGMFEAGIEGQMEQLWLAFYMDEKHKLIWENNKWKKQEQHQEK